jgi:SAM-dependent methyltransferase
MHPSAFEHGRLFFELYWQPEFSEVVELGSQNVNGSLRDHCPAGARYLGMDMVAGNGVDLVVMPGKPFPLADDSVDAAVTSSAFEHDVCFWETFLDLIRILKPGGLLYVNAPSNHSFHRYPVDCWRFYPDAGHALQVWAARRGVTVELLESFVAKPFDRDWADYVAVFRKAWDQPIRRKGRIADHTTAMNIYDAGRPDPAQLEAKRSETWDMLEEGILKERIGKSEEDLAAARSQIQDLQAGLAQARSQAAELRAQIAALEDCLAQATQHSSEFEIRANKFELARATAERELRTIKSSAAWRLVSPIMKLSRT